MVKILNFFIIQARTFKLLLFIDLGTLNSYLLEFLQSDQKWISEIFLKMHFFEKIQFHTITCLFGLFQPFPIKLGFWNYYMLLLSKMPWVTTFQNPKRSKVMAARSKKVIFSKIGTPPSVFELGLWNFQNVEIFLWPKNSLIKILK